jgi:HD-like signal output (HDOD) protein
MNEDILSKIEKLPPLPESTMKIEAVYQDPDSSFNDMVKILEKDPILTANILKAANSPLYGFAREINEISQAVSLFGMGTIRGFALASIMDKTFKLDLSPYGISNETFSKISKKQHSLMVSWCLRKENKLIGVLSPASFLVEIGKVLIAQTVITDGKQDDFKQALADFQSIEEAEKKIFSVDTPEVSATIFTKWKFDNTLIDVIRNCLNPEQADEKNQRATKILHVVRTAVTINGTLDDQSLKDAKALIKKYDLDMESFEKATESA